MNTTAAQTITIVRYGLFKNDIVADDVEMLVVEGDILKCEDQEVLSDLLDLLMLVISGELLVGWTAEG